MYRKSVSPLEAPVEQLLQTKTNAPTQYHLLSSASFVQGRHFRSNGCHVVTWAVKNAHGNFSMALEVSPRKSFSSSSVWFSYNFHFWGDILADTKRLWYLNLTSTSGMSWLGPVTQRLWCLTLDHKVPSSNPTSVYLVIPEPFSELLRRSN